MRLPSALVVVRAGDRSLHPHWLIGPRSWDIAISAYGEHVDSCGDEYRVIHVSRGTKWEGVAQFLDMHRDLVEEYDYVWFPDDDLLTTSQSISRFFDICRQQQLIVAQPSLTRDSFYSYPITLQRDGSVCRLTDFVEIMAPCFRVSELSHFEWTFGLNSSGWGLEWMWADIAKRRGDLRFGIVDDIAVRHVRPVGSAGHGGARDPQRDMEKLLREAGLTRSKPRVLGRVPNGSSAALAALRRIGRDIQLLR